MPEDDTRFSFATFDMQRVLRYAVPLLGSAGSEYDVDPELFSLDPKERLRRQRQNLQKQLGLGCESGNVEDLLDESDLSLPLAVDLKKRKREGDDNNDAATRHFKEVKLDLAGMSARERNRALRMAKLKKKDQERQFRETGTVAVVDTSILARTAVMTEQGDGSKLVLESKVDAAGKLRFCCFCAFVERNRAVEMEEREQKRRRKKERVSIRMLAKI